MKVKELKQALDEVSLDAEIMICAKHNGQVVQTFVIDDLLQIIPRTPQETPNLEIFSIVLHDTKIDEGILESYEDKK